MRFWCWIKILLIIIIHNILLYKYHTRAAMRRIPVFDSNKLRSIIKSLVIFLFGFYLDLVFFVCHAPRLYNWKFINLKNFIAFLAISVADESASVSECKRKLEHDQWSGAWLRRLGSFLLPCLVWFGFFTVNFQWQSKS